MPLRTNPSVWWALPGVVAAYQPVRAPGPLLARYNMANGGVNAYRAEPGTLPTWSARLGWTGGSNAYLTTGILASSNWTYVVRFSGGTASGDQCLLGSRGSWPNLHEIFHVTSGNSYFMWGGVYDVGVAVTSGVLAMASKLFYRDGKYLGTTVAPAPTITNACYLMASNASGSVSYRFTGSIQGVGIFARQLSAADVWSVSRQLAYCDVNPDWNVWARRRQWFLAPQGGFQVAWARNANVVIKQVGE